MPRSPRIEYEGAIYHVMARGDRREPIVTDDEDRKTFVRTLGQVCGRTGWEVFAWVLMDNHYHIALRTPEPNLVAGMQWFQNTFTRRINVRHKLWGHLFGGRYKSILVEGSGTESGRLRQPYLPALIDYIHLNPVRAGMINLAENGLVGFPWSSLVQGYSKPPTKRAKWLAVKEGLAQFDEKDMASGRRRYLTYLHERAVAEERERAGLTTLEGASLQSTLRRGWYWGSEEFKEGLLEKIEKVPEKNENRNDVRPDLVGDHHLRAAEEILQLACRHFRMEERKLLLSKYGDQTKAAIAWKLWRHTSVSQKWIAERMDMRSAANVSQTVRRFEEWDERELPRMIFEWKKKNIVT